MQGIAMKLNSKCYGLNFLVCCVLFRSVQLEFQPIFKDYMHDLDLEKNPDLLVIGYDVAHPTPVGIQLPSRVLPFEVHSAENLFRPLRRS